MFGDKGFYYTFDGILSATMLVGVILLVVNAGFTEEEVNQRDFASEDVTNVISEMKVSELDASEQSIINDNTNVSNDSTVVRGLTELWALNQSDKARQVLQSVVDEGVPNETSIRFSIEGEVILEDNNSKEENVFTRSRMISGVEAERPSTGTSASAFLRSVEDKLNTKYAYFGGFVGQGNLTVFLEDLPSDVNSSRIENLTMQADFGSDFELFINGDFCGSRSVNSDVLAVEEFSFNSCHSSLEPGRNEFGFNFTEDLQNASIRGGEIRVEYRTDELLENITTGSKTHQMPGIRGIANLFSSFYIPGDLTNMSINVTYDTKASSELSIGERVIELNDDEGNITEGIDGSSESLGNGRYEYDLRLDNEFLQNEALIDYDLISNNTVPLRFSSFDTTQKVLESGDADVILISDYSGSMMRAIDNWGMGNRRSECSNALEDSETRRVDLATCLNQEFTGRILNFTGNRIWPVTIYKDNIEWYNNPKDEEAIKGFFDNYENGKGQVCMSCAMSQAYNILDQYSNDSREKFIVVMSDGVPTHCGDGSCQSMSTDFGAEQCEGLCNKQGNCPASTRSSQCQECIDNPGAAENFEYSSNETRKDLDADIFTIGFGPINDTCSQAGKTMKKVAEIGNGTYQHSKNNTELQLIYENVSNEIFSRVDQENQTVQIKGEVQRSNLHKESRIEMEYDPLVDDPSPDRIEVNIQEELDTDCETTIDIPSEVEVVDSKVLSYSGNSWSDLVQVNNETVFNMTDYLVPYERLGDPYEVVIPPSSLEGGSNEIFVETGTSPENRTGCSDYDGMVYTALIPSLTLRTEAKTEVEGCNWSVEFEDGSVETLAAPLDYNGSETCSYTSSSIEYNENDTYDAAVHDLMSQIDFDDNGKVFVNIEEFDLEVATTAIENVPFLWGPVNAVLEVW